MNTTKTVGTEVLMVMAVVFTVFREMTLVAMGLWVIVMTISAVVMVTVAMVMLPGRRGE